MNIAGVEIGREHPCRVVAEVSNNHNGDFDRCIRLLDAIQAAGADFAKFQCYRPDELVALRGDGPAPDPWGSEGWTMRDLYEKAQTPHEWFPELVAHCEAIGLPWFSSVFGGESLALLESLGCPAYKIAALDMGSPHLWEWTDRTGKPIVCSLRAPYQVGGDLNLYCPEGYPQDPADLTYPRPMFQYWFDGLSYHGTDTAPLIEAARKGASLLECHVQLAAEPSELESNVSLTEVQLAQVCGEIR